MDWLAEDVGVAMVDERHTPTLWDGMMALHERVAERLQSSASRQERSAKALMADKQNAAAHQTFEHALSARRRAQEARDRADGLRELYAVLVDDARYRT
jgi:hypothetical protein